MHPQQKTCLFTNNELLINHYQSTYHQDIIKISSTYQPPNKSLTIHQPTWIAPSLGVRAWKDKPWLRADARQRRHTTDADAHGTSAAQVVLGGEATLQVP